MRASVGGTAVAAALAAAGPAGAAAEAPCPLHDANNAEVIQFIFFDPDKAAFDHQAVMILDYVVGVSAEIPQCPIYVDGHADRSGPDVHNLALSKRRADAVVAYLRQHGVRAEIRVHWWGETRPLVDTPDGAREPQNRRVDLYM